MTEAQSFRRRVDSLAEIFEFNAATFKLLGIDQGFLPAIDLTLEELFTNMVKYSRSKADVRIEIGKVAGGVEVTLLDEGVDFFDVTRPAPVDVNKPLEMRKPGGLGLHLIQHLVDSIEYEYEHEHRRSRITLRKTGA